jgi:hypothetical protein
MSGGKSEGPCAFPVHRLVKNKSEGLLEWETAAQWEMERKRKTPVDLYLPNRRCRQNHSNAKTVSRRGGIVEAVSGDAQWFRDRLLGWVYNHY